MAATSIAAAYQHPVSTEAPVDTAIGFTEPDVPDRTRPRPHRWRPVHELYRRRRWSPSHCAPVLLGLSLLIALALRWGNGPSADDEAPPSGGSR